MNDRAAWILGVLLLSVWLGWKMQKFWEIHRNVRSLRHRLDLVSLNPVPRRGGHKWDFSRACCPDCRSILFHPGPSGGMAHNIKCAGCGAKFWYAPPFTPKRIESDDSVYRLNVKRTLEDIA